MANRSPKNVQENKLARSCELAKVKGLTRPYLDSGVYDSRLIYSKDVTHKREIQAIPRSITVKKTFYNKLNIRQTKTVTHQIKDSKGKQLFLYVKHSRYYIKDKDGELVRYYGYQTNKVKESRGLDLSRPKLTPLQVKRRRKAIKRLQVLKPKTIDLSTLKPLTYKRKKRHYSLFNK